MLRSPSCAALAASALLAACATLAPEVRAPEPFDLVGRMAVRHDERAFASNVRWHHRPGRDEIWLLTPAGQTLAYIVSDSAGATLTGADQRQYSAADVESLTRQGLGWALPLTHLGWWVRGKLAPGTAAQNVERDERARLIGFTQDGWRVTLMPDPAPRNGHLPRRLQLADGQVAIRLVIDAWRSETGP